MLIPLVSLVVAAALTVTFGSRDPVLDVVCTEKSSLDVRLDVPPQLGAFPGHGTTKVEKKTQTLAFDKAKDTERTRVEYVHFENTRGDQPDAAPLDKQIVIIVRTGQHFDYEDEAGHRITNHAVRDELEHRFNANSDGERSLFMSKTFSLGQKIDLDPAAAERVWGDGFPGLRAKASFLKVAAISPKGDQARVDFKIPLVVEGGNGTGEFTGTGSILFDVATLREVHTSMEGPLHISLATPASGLGTAGEHANTNASLPAIKGTFSAVADVTCAPVAPPSK